MKKYASILIVVVIINLIGGIIFGLVVISKYEQPVTGILMISGSIMFNFALLAFAEIGINIAEIRNAIEMHVKIKSPGIGKRPALKEDQPIIKDTNEDWECSECGALISADAEKCPKCGADVSEIEE